MSNQCENNEVTSVKEKVDKPKFLAILSIINVLITAEFVYLCLVHDFDARFVVLFSVLLGASLTSTYYNCRRFVKGREKAAK